MGYRDSGAQIATTNIWELEELNSKNITPEMKELFVRLYQNLNNMAMAVNGKDTGIYHTDEFVTGQLYPQDPTLTSASSSTPIQRPVYRKVINFGALPNAANKTVAHGMTINANFTFTRIYGCASDPAGLTYIPIPYASNTANDSIELWIDNTNVNITTAADWTAYTKCWVVVETMKF